MEIVAAVAVLAPIVILFLLATAVTVHFFWLSHVGRWPPDLTPPAPGRREAHGARQERRGPRARAWR